MRLAGWVALAVLASSNTFAMAQTPAASVVQPITDAAADQTFAQVLLVLPQGRNSQGLPLGPVPSNAPKPLLPAALVKEIMEIGAYSGIGEACGLDWAEANFLKLMARERKRGGYSDHQLGAIGMTHGLMQARYSMTSATAEACSAAKLFYKSKWPS